MMCDSPGSHFLSQQDSTTLRCNLHTWGELVDENLRAYLVGVREDRTVGLSRILEPYPTSGIERGWQKVSIPGVESIIAVLLQIKQGGDEGRAVIGTQNVKVAT